MIFFFFFSGITPDIQENMANFLKCFGNIGYDEEVIMIPV